MNSFVSLDNISVKFRNNFAIRNISGTFNKGSLTAIAGPNGAGKSTLLRLIAERRCPTEGSVFIDNEAVIGYLPQASFMDRTFPISVLQTVCTGFWRSIGNMRAVSDAKIELARNALRKVGLVGVEDRQISELSGGQFQRLLFARLIVQKANLILLDEPFASIDAFTTERLMRIILDWHSEGKTIICVLHDLLLIQKYFPDSFVMAGTCLGQGHTHKMLEDKLLSFDLDMAELCAGEDGKLHDKHMSYNRSVDLNRYKCNG
ncbi:MAG: ABC transporter ATP-binding protein [Alphaproteobacteria bacterium]|nr:ABC transporter ATP-binding protein [Alphaproteobacteria bacterium]MCL2505376.1 ABC transporter ATP-binding protein [Alphaproteobacteria bacterium]